MTDVDETAATNLAEMMRQLQFEKGPARPPGPDVGDRVPEARREAFQVVKDLIVGQRPTTVLGVLIERRRPIEVLTIAGLIGKPITEVEWTVEILTEEGFCRTLDDDGIKVVELVKDWA